MTATFFPLCRTDVHPVAVPCPRPPMTVAPPFLRRSCALPTPFGTAQAKTLVCGWMWPGGGGVAVCESAPGMHWKGGGVTPPPSNSRAPSLCPATVPLTATSTAFVTDSNRPQPLRQPPPTACLTAPRAASEASSPYTAPLVSSLARFRPGPSAPASRTLA